MAVGKVSDADAEVLKASGPVVVDLGPNGAALPHDRTRARRNFGAMGDKVKIVVECRREPEDGLEVRRCRSRP
jgi:hypothetical protein